MAKDNAPAQRMYEFAGVNIANFNPSLYRTTP